MKLLSTALVSLLVAAPLLAQCQAKAISQPGVCNQGNGWSYQQYTYVVGSGTATETFFDPAHVTVTIPFRPTSNVTVSSYNVGRFKLVPVNAAAFNFYDQGVLVVTVHDAASAQVMSAHVRAIWFAIPTWVTDVKYVFTRGASDGCNYATGVAGLVAVGGIVAAAEGSISGVLGTIPALYEAYMKELAACGY